MWVYYGLFSAVFLGLYDTVRKKALNNNAVIPVLFLASCTVAAFFLPVVLLSKYGVINQGGFLYVPEISMVTHGLIFLKSVIVGTSWCFAYFAISKLPLTIVVPIRATGPTWTILGAMIIYGERFTVLQWIGITVVLIFFYIFSVAGKKEGINFIRNRWIFLVVAATLLGAASGLYDKYLLGNFNRMAVQAWFSIYVIPVFIPFLLFIWYPGRKKTASFHWSPYIHLIGVVLIISDFLYFYSLSLEGALIAVLSVLRRSSIILSFIAGAVIFGEGNLKRKALAMTGILMGVIIIVLGTLAL